MTVIHDQVKAQALSQEIDTLLAKGAILPVNPLRDPGGFYSKYFLIPKKTGGLRPILDLRGLNLYMKSIPFHMLSIRDVLQAISPGDWFTLVDLKDAYFHVPIAPQHWRFLRFAFQGRHFQFRVLPFGLSLSPRVFTRCMAAALCPLQARGLKILPYLDDWLVCAPTEAQAAADTRTLLDHMDLLGLCVNWQKSNLIPSQQVTFLGITMDSLSMTARPSPQRVESILQMLPAFLPGRAAPFVLYLRLLGKLTAAATVVPLGLLSLRPLQMWLNSLRLDPSRASHRHRKLQVSPQCLVSLAQWREAEFMIRGVPLGLLPSRWEVVSTDASTTGWGALWQRQIARGTWSPRERRHHINALELEAVHRALRHFLPILRGRHVLVRSDNTSVVFHINHQGGTRSLMLDPEASDLCSPSFCQPEGDPHPGGAECSCRHPIPGASTTGGVEAPPGCSGNYLGEVRESSRRFVRFPRDDTLPAVVLPVGQCQSPRSGCAVARLAEGTPLRLPATSPDRPNTPEGPSGGTSAPSGGPPVAREDLVSDAAQALLQLSDASSLQEGPAVTAGRSDPASQSQSPPTLGLATTGPGVSFSEYGGDIGHTMTNARAPSTRLVYAHKWKAFSRWCQERNEDPVHCPVSVILTFLQALLSQGRSPSTLKVYVAAISCWHSVVSGETVGRNKDVSLFLRGARRLHPPTRPVVPVWDLSIVLAALRSPPYEPLAGASLECVSKKTAFLLAMASAKRVSELHALSVHESCCRWNPAGSGVTLWPNAAFLPKVASPASHTGPLQLARLDTDGPDELLCPVRALKTYVSLTASLRQADNLFVCYAGPRKGQALSKQRLARWIVDVVEQAYIQRGLQPPAGVRCHSTRGVSVSWAAMTGLTLEAICSAASWSSPNTFARFYRVNLATPHPMQGILSQRTPSSQ